jgi:hypothetical protein
VLAAEHLLDLGRLHFLVERVERVSELGLYRFTRLVPLDEDGKVVVFLGQRPREVAILLQPSAALQDSLRFGLVFPEIGGGGARFEARQFIVGTGGFKDSSADRRRVC